MRRWFVPVVWLAVVSPCAVAQRGSVMHMGSANARSAAVASPAVHRMSPSGATRSAGPGIVVKTATTSAHRGTVARTIHPSNNALRRPVDFDDDFGFSGDFFGVPGLGFDEAHLAAIRGPRAFHRRFGFSGGISPFFGGGFLFPSPVVIEQAPATEVQQEEEAQPVAQEPAQRFRTRESYVVQPVEPAAAPQGASEEYVFVRRDGTLFFAVAYSWDNQTLRYITQEGVRRSVTREALDLAATQQFNEQRGLNFRLPA